MMVVFEEIRMNGKKSFKCACGKRITRQTTFSQTINPFNKNKQGNPKSKSEIYAELDQERNEWLKKVDPCNHVVDNTEDEE